MLYKISLLIIIKSKILKLILITLIYTEATNEFNSNKISEFNMYKFNNFSKHDLQFQNSSLIEKEFNKIYKLNPHNEKIYFPNIQDNNTDLNENKNINNIIIISIKDLNKFLSILL